VAANTEEEKILEDCTKLLNAAWRYIFAVKAGKKARSDARRNASPTLP